MKKIVLLLILVFLTSCEGYQTVVYTYGIRQRPEPRPRRVYHYYTPYSYYPVVTPIYVYSPRFRAPYYNVRGNNFQQHQGGRRR